MKLNVIMCVLSKDKVIFSIDEVQHIVITSFIRPRRILFLIRGLRSNFLFLQNEI